MEYPARVGKRSPWQAVRRVRKTAACGADDRLPGRPASLSRSAYSAVLRLVTATPETASAACTWPLIAAACATVGFGAAHSAGREAAREPTSQAGARVYGDQCASCHGATRSGGFGPPVSGPA